MDEILYSTPEQQVEKLISQNLIIKDKKYAQNQLQLYGYSNLIKSYREPYIITSDNKKIYRDGVTFEQIESLYFLDKNLRNAVMGAMLDLEEHVKEAAADVIAKSFGTHPDEYLRFKNYRDKKKNYRFSLDAILTTMRKTLNTDKNPIAHYAKEHNIVPPWILFKSIYFSTIINFIHLFKPTEQNMVAAHLYNTEQFDIQKVPFSQLMMDTLFVCLEYRNKSAHGGRIYNHNSDARLKSINDQDSSLHGFSQLLLLLRLLKYQAPYKQLDSALSYELNRHCSLFPEDITYLGQILNVNIITTDIVWISSKSKKYHYDQHCSGIPNAKKIDIEKAKSQGFEPCKRCSTTNKK